MNENNIWRIVFHNYKLARTDQMDELEFWISIPKEQGSTDAKRLAEKWMEREGIIHNWKAIKVELLEPKDGIIDVIFTRITKSRGI